MNSRFVPKIEKPCPANWDEMKGDEKRRFCEHCQLHVHNLSAMTQAEQQALVTSAGDRKCVTYISETGTKVVDSRSWFHLQSSWLRRVAATVIAGIGSFFVAGCHSSRTTGMVPPPEVSPTKTDADAKRTMGSPVVPPPAQTWGRRLMGRVQMTRKPTTPPKP